MTEIPAHLLNRAKKANDSVDSPHSPNAQQPYKFDARRALVDVEANQPNSPEANTLTDDEKNKARKEANVDIERIANTVGGIIAKSPDEKKPRGVAVSREMRPYHGARNTAETVATAGTVKLPVNDNNDNYAADLRLTVCEGARTWGLPNPIEVARRLLGGRRSSFTVYPQSDIGRSDAIESGFRYVEAGLYSAGEDEQRLLALIAVLTAYDGDSAIRNAGENAGRNQFNALFFREYREDSQPVYDRFFGPDERGRYPMKGGHLLDDGNSSKYAPLPDSPEAAIGATASRKGKTGPLSAEVINHRVELNKEIDPVRVAIGGVKAMIVQLGSDAGDLGEINDHLADISEQFINSAVSPE